MKALYKAGLFKGEVAEAFEKAFIANRDYMRA